MKKLNPDKFKDYLHCEPYHMLDIGHYVFADPYKMQDYYFYRRYKKQFIAELKKKAIGYCEASALNLKPREFGYAVLCKKENGERGWFVVDEDLFEKANA